MTQAALGAGRGRNRRRSRVDARSACWSSSWSPTRDSWTPARELLEADLTALDLTCSRFRTDSELVAVGNAARERDGPVTVTVSPLLARGRGGLPAGGQLTDGDVDPTVGGVLPTLGYDRDFAELPARRPAGPA